MKHLNDLSRMFDFYETVSVPVNSVQREQFVLYHELLTRWARKQNLISRNDIPHIVDRHFVPSLFLVANLPGDTNGPVIDIGSGGGFPGVVLKIMRPDLSVTLLDSSRKKAIFLREVTESLGIDSPVICERSEVFQQTNNKVYGLAVSRAVARLEVLWEWVADMLLPGARYCVLKGGDCADEITEVKKKDIHVGMCLPDQKWLNYGDYMDSKFMVIMEK